MLPIRFRKRAGPALTHVRAREWLVLLAALVVAPLALAAPASAAKPLTVLTFTETASQPVDGLSVSGVTFGFTVNGVASTDARYNAGGPGTLMFVQDPSLEGNANGVLTLHFDQPTTVLDSSRTTVPVSITAPSRHTARTPAASPNRRARTTPPPPAT